MQSKAFKKQKDAATTTAAPATTKPAATTTVTNTTTVKAPAKTTVKLSKARRLLSKYLGRKFPELLLTRFSTAHLRTLRKQKTVKVFCENLLLKS